MINQAPKITAGIENGTNQMKIFQLMAFRNTAILEAELENVPIVNENGITEEGKIKFKIGIKIKLAPPPEIALIQKAISVARNNSIIIRNIIFICLLLQEINLPILREIYYVKSKYENGRPLLIIILISCFNSVVTLNGICRDFRMPYLSTEVSCSCNQPETYK